MSDDVAVYEFSAEFRGEGYTWHPSTPAYLANWEQVFGWCLRQRLSSLCVEFRGGRRWAVHWSPKSQAQVRGGSLQFQVLHTPESSQTDMPMRSDEEWRNAMMGMLTTPAPWRLRASTWQLLLDPDSTFLRTLVDLGVVLPEFAILSESTEVGEALVSLQEPGSYVVISEADSPPSVGGQLLLDWVEGENWLVDRIGTCQRSWKAMLAGKARSDILAKFDELATLSQTKLVGWEASEQALMLVSDIASRWSGAPPRWSVHIGEGLQLPEIDIVAGSVGLPNDARAQALAARAGAPASVKQTLSLHRKGGAYVKLVLALGVAFVVGLALGFVGGFVLGRNLALDVRGPAAESPVTD